MFVVAGVMGGCGSGDTSATDLQKEKDEIKKQTPANLTPVDPGNDMKTMGSGNDQSNIMPKGIRGKK